MTTAEKCEKIMRLIIDAAMKGHKVTVDVDETSEDVFLAVEAKNYMCLLSYPSDNFEFVIEELSKGL